ncbi:hypothetical protein [Frigoriglobus tundricola]|uniref:DUF5678 domain-containing protein n=1 Tax=Frigoriglobus tundricola TaxID=2774151 RepID=A0A6M5Z1C3_9BACT|nr:hypothetical protein [Frigoriglobus tundricola]QJX00130.1 hypothetical protein FTUN_7754 [Frigoriglobus tundricola]
MIRALKNAPLMIDTPEVSAEERIANVSAGEQFQLNLMWWNTHVEEIRAAYTGKFVCVAGQELFAGDDPIEVIARAKAAHPNPGYGFFSLFLSPHRGPKIHAHQRRVV